MTYTTCPSWCNSEHPEGESEPRNHFGPHWPPLPGEDGFAADVASVKRDGIVGVWLAANHKEHLTTLQARSVARALFAAADWVDTNGHT